MTDLYATLLEKGSVFVFMFVLSSPRNLYYTYIKQRYIYYIQAYIL